MSSLLSLAGNAAPTGFYDFPIEQSLRFEDGDSAYLSRTPASAGNQKTFTISAWVKRTELPASYRKGRILTCGTSLGSNLSNSFFFGFDDDESLRVYQEIGGATSISIDTNAVYRDVSGWLSVICSVDTTQATASDRLKLYVNGEQITSLASSTYPSLNTDCWVNDNSAHWIGRSQGSDYSSFYLAEYNLIDGQQLDATSFGELKSGIWIPKDTSGLTFGTNGFRLAFADGAAIGDDTSGNTNDWTVNNLVASDVVPDSPTNNWCVISPLLYRWSITAPVLSEGNLKIDPGSTITSYVLGTVGVSSGKWYYEGMVDAVATTAIGFGFGNEKLADSDETDSIFYRRGSTGTIRSGGTNIATGVGDIVADDVVGVYVDLDAGEISFYNNGSIIGASPYALPTSGITLLPAILQANANNFYINFGQDSTFTGRRAAGGNTDANGLGDFAYAPPSGALSLCSANLPTGAIDTLNDETPEDYFNTVLYSGNSSTQSITGVGFQPDWVWLKVRNSTNFHQLTDAVRGVGNKLSSDQTTSEDFSSNRLTSFDADGFSLGDNGSYNESGENYVAWNWKANGAGVLNEEGTIDSTVSVGATSQQGWFSIVSYTGNKTAGATVGHGLGVTPDMIIVKNRDDADGWRIYHSGVASDPETDYLEFTTAAAVDATNMWNDTAPTPSVFSLGTASSTNQTGENFIAYCFANAEGLCKVGSYTGNGSADGTFVFTGHRPAFLLIKKSNSTGAWVLIDNKRDETNAADKVLQAHVSNAESSGTDRLDILSNGFKFRTDGGAYNASGDTYIYLSIAEQPFAFANAR